GSELAVRPRSRPAPPRGGRDPEQGTAGDRVWSNKSGAGRSARTHGSLNRRSGKDGRVLAEMEQPFTKTGYFDLQALAAFSCCSVRWLRDRLADHTHPLPYHRVEGKLLVKREDFDRWIDHYRVCQQL